MPTASLVIDLAPEEAERVAPCVLKAEVRAATGEPASADVSLTLQGAGSLNSMQHVTEAKHRARQGELVFEWWTFPRNSPASALRGEVCATVAEGLTVRLSRIM